MTSLKRHCDVKWRATGTFLVSMERGDSFLSSSTKIMRIGGLIAPSSVDVLQKMAPVDQGYFKPFGPINQKEYAQDCCP